MPQDLYTLNSDVIHRRANGKTIWQPRILCWYGDREFRHEELPGKYKGCNPKQLYEKLGCSDRLYNFCACFGGGYDETVKSSWRRIDDLTSESIIETPVGTINQITRGNRSNYGSMPIKWYAEEEDDLKVLIYLEEHTNYTFSMDTYNKMLAEYRHLGLPAFYFPRVNMQKMIVELSGVENTYYLLADCPDTVEAYFKALSDAQMRFAGLVVDSPFEWVNYGDNLHCKVTPPEYFEKYVLPEYAKRRELLAPSGKFLYSHFDGEFRDYFPYMKSEDGCFLDGYEALTPKPQGDVTVEEMKEAVGDQFLVDGIAAILFAETHPVQTLVDQAKRVLELFEGQLVLGISDELASDAVLERVELVRDIVEEFNAKH